MADNLCPLCSKEMAPNPLGLAGDPAFVCLTDDAAHRAAAEARKLECEALLREAARPKSGPTPEEIAAIGARSRPDMKAVEADPVVAQK